MKKLFSALITLALLASLTAALASPGTSSDPLISQSYAEGVFRESILAAGDEIIADRFQIIFAQNAAQLETIRPDAWGFRLLSMKAGSTVELADGCSFLLVRGTVTVEVKRGAVLEISTAAETPSGTALTPNLRYFCVEDTAAVFTADVDSAVMVDGGYFSSEGVNAAFTQYLDVSPADWFYDSAQFTYEQQLFPDFEADHFLPNDDATRAEMVYALWKTVGEPEPSTESGFVDLTEDWYMQAVNWAAEQGIVNGRGEGIFDPSGSLTREEMAAILYRYVESIGGDVSARADLSAFQDRENISPYAVDYLRWTCAMGIIKGVSPTELGARYLARRGQVATILMRYVG